MQIKMSKKVKTKKYFKSILITQNQIFLLNKQQKFDRMKGENI